MANVCAPLHSPQCATPRIIPTYLPHPSNSPYQCDSYITIPVSTPFISIITITPSIACLLLMVYCCVVMFALQGGVVCLCNRTTNPTQLHANNSRGGADIGIGIYKFWNDLHSSLITLEEDLMCLLMLLIIPVSMSTSPQSYLSWKVDIGIGICNDAGDKVHSPSKRECTCFHSSMMIATTYFQ